MKTNLIEATNLALRKGLKIGKIAGLHRFVWPTGTTMVVGSKAATDTVQNMDDIFRVINPLAEDNPLNAVSVGKVLVSNTLNPDWEKALAEVSEGNLPAGFFLGQETDYIEKAVK